jgi:hypothetical protein
MPEILTEIRALMKYETAGDPIGGLKWTRRTTRKIADALSKKDIHVSKNTVGRLLKSIDFRLRVNHKKRSTTSPPQRDAQFQYIKKKRKAVIKRGDPVISIDCKKKELVGDFKNPGKAWRESALEVLDHDFRSKAKGTAAPFGFYDQEANRGFIVVGTSRETPEFVVDCLGIWWRLEGRVRYPNSKHILILADCGGGNGYRCRVWKVRLQERFCDRHHVSVTICHYPPGASKWNPIEHFLFNQISENWQGQPLESYERILKSIRTTTTETGLKVRATLNTKSYPTGVKVSDEELDQVSLREHKTLPRWNYTITPR